MSNRRTTPVHLFIGICRHSLHLNFFTNLLQSLFLLVKSQSCSLLDYNFLCTHSYCRVVSITVSFSFEE